MATYNGERFIKDQISSILNQKFDEENEIELELVISDDGSTDSTVNIINEINDDRIKLYHHKNKRTHKYFNSAFACTENFNYAVSKATGDYIFLSDQDDVWYEWKLQTSLTALWGGGFDVVGTAFDIGDKELNKIGEVIYKKQKLFSIRYKHSLYGFSCGFHKDALSYLLPFPDVPQHDTFIMLSAQIRNRIGYIDKRCAIHRWSGVHNVSNATNNDVPKYVKLYYRTKMWFVVLWRYALGGSRERSMNRQ